MIDIRPFGSLGHADHGWLNARHHFSFAGYHDPARMGWGPIRVWNDDEIGARSGFPPHPHANMEIITFVRDGAITHRDSLGNTGRTAAGDVQVMSAGSGITHAEYNLEDELTRIFQIWIEPRVAGGAPSWGTRAFPAGSRAGLVTLASGFGEPDALPLQADARIRAGRMQAGDTLMLDLAPGARAYLVPASGAVTVNGHEAQARDGVAIEGESRVAITASADAELVLVEATALS